MEQFHLTVRLDRPGLPPLPHTGDNQLYLDCYDAGVADAQVSQNIRMKVHERLRLLENALRYHVEAEDKPCRLDHHGYCQEHGSFEEGRCMVKQHRRLLGLETS